MRMTLATLAALSTLSSPALAKIPVQQWCTIDPVVVGDPGGAHAYRVRMIGIDGLPLTHFEAILDFSKTSVRLGSAQEAGVTLDCTARTLFKLTDMNGWAEFHPRFGGSCAGGTVTVIGRDVELASVPLRSTDLDGVDACVGLQDFVLFAGPFLEGGSHPELDFDNSGGAIGLGDFVTFSRDLLSGAKGAYCP